MKQIILNTTIALLSVVGLAATVNLALSATPALASAKSEVLGGAGATGMTGGGVTVEGGITSVVNVMLFILGAIAVIVIIIAGIMFTVSAGDPARAKKAKDAILYAVIGLVVALLAYAIVNFVVDAFN